MHFRRITRSVVKSASGRRLRHIVGMRRPILSIGVVKFPGTEGNMRKHFTQPSPEEALGKQKNEHSMGLKISRILQPYYSRQPNDHRSSGLKRLSGPLSPPYRARVHWQKAFYQGPSLLIHFRLPGKSQLLAWVDEDTHFRLRWLCRPGASSRNPCGHIFYR